MSGFTAAGLERLHTVASSHVGATNVPGLVALVASGNHVHVEVLGELTIGGAPVARDSLFRIASTTKPIAAAATLVLAAEGLLDLDEPVDRLLPELANRQVLRTIDGALDDTIAAIRPVTARDLLTFTGGFGMVLELFMSPTPWPIVDAANALSLGTFGPPAPDLQPDPDTWIANLGSLPLMAQPGQRWMYNTGASILGVLLARAARQPLSDVLRTRLFEPLGMKDTAFWTPNSGRLATSYRPTPEDPVVWDEPAGAWSRPPAFGDAAGGLLSTADDLLAFARMLTRGGAPVLVGDAVATMTTDQLSVAQKAHGGLGFDFFAHQSWGFCLAVHDDGSFGWDGGLGTSWRVDPTNDLVTIVMTQLMFATSDTPPVHRDIQTAARAALA